MALEDSSFRASYGHEFMSYDMEIDPVDVPSRCFWSITCMEVFF